MNLRFNNNHLNTYLPRCPHRRRRRLWRRSICCRWLLLVALFIWTVLVQQFPYVESMKISKETWKSLRQHPNPVPSIEELSELPNLHQEIDRILDRVQNGPADQIIQGYKPQGAWLWRQWFGTVLVHAAPTAMFNMSIAFIFCLVMQYWIHGYDGHFVKFMKSVFTDVPTSTVKGSLILDRLVVVDKVWKTLMSLTTFLLSFFIGQAFTFWTTVLNCGRGIQGRFNDLHMLLAAYCCTVPTSGPRRGTYKYTPEATEFLLEFQQKLKAFHLLFWSSRAHRFRVLLTPQGFQRMVERGILTSEELQFWNQLELPPENRFVSCLESAIVSFQKALRNKHIIKDVTTSNHSNTALERTILDKLCTLRGTYGTIGDMVDGRMPLAYAHFVQVLVDSFLFLAPIAQ